MSYIAHFTPQAMNGSRHISLAIFSFLISLNGLVFNDLIFAKDEFNRSIFSRIFVFSNPPTTNVPNPDGLYPVMKLLTPGSKATTIVRRFVFEFTQWDR